MTQLSLSPVSLSPTHKKGNTLDLLFPQAINILDLHQINLSWADHQFLIFSIQNWISTTPSAPLKRPRVAKFLRPLNRITLPVFQETYYQLRATMPSPTSVDEQYTWLSSLIQQTLDVIAPLRCKWVDPIKPQNAPWFNNSIHQLRLEGRRLERRWKSSQAAEDKQACKLHQQQYKAAIQKAKLEFFNAQITNAKNSSSELFRVTAKYSAKPANPSAKPSDAPTAQALSDFFSAKVAKIRNTIQLKRQTSVTPTCLTDPSCTGNAPELPTAIPLAKSPDQAGNLSHFKLLPPHEVLQILASLRNSTAPSDLIPTKLFKLLAPAFINDLTALINHSLAAGIFPSSAKSGTIIPLLKKSSLPTKDVESYRPITLLPVMARLLEKVVTIQLQLHLESGPWLHDRQSGFRPSRGTEVAVTDILQHLLRIREASHPVALILLDLSAAFDTIDHTILLERLGTLGGLAGPVLTWFRSFLHARVQQVRLGQEVAAPTISTWGVPQGSALSPLLFNVYMVPLARLIQSFGLIFQTYADDTQLVVDLDHAEPDREAFPAALLAIQAWMEDNWLCLNEGKTEILLSGRGPGEAECDLPWPAAFGPCPAPVEKVRNLGVYINAGLSSESHALAMVSAGHYQLNRLRCLLPWLSLQNRVTICNASVLSRIMYCNLIFTGASAKVMAKLQALQNRTIRAIMPQLGWRDHLTAPRNELKWLTVTNQILHKQATTAWTISRNQGPEYLQSWVEPKISTSTTNSLRSARAVIFPIPKYSKEKMGGHLLKTQLPRLWNTLPMCLKDLPSKSRFSKAMRCHLLDRQARLPP